MPLDPCRGCPIGPRDGVAPGILLSFAVWAARIASWQQHGQLKQQRDICTQQEVSPSHRKSPSTAPAAQSADFDCSAQVTKKQALPHLVGWRGHGPMQPMQPPLDATPVSRRRVSANSTRIHRRAPVCHIAQVPGTSLPGMQGPVRHVLGTLAN